jgi:plasmid stability protein
MTRMTTRLPEHLAQALAARAQANHRSINGELCAILEAAISGTPESKLCKSS